MKTNKVLLAFSLTVISSIVALAEIFVPQFREAFPGSVLQFVPFAVFFLLSALLLLLTIRSQTNGVLRTFLLVTGASGAGIFISILLHNVISGTFIRFFGEGIWQGVGGDEPFFFVLGTIVFPALYLIGALGTLVTSLIRRRR